MSQIILGLAVAGLLAYAIEQQSQRFDASTKGTEDMSHQIKHKMHAHRKMTSHQMKQHKTVFAERVQGKLNI